MHIAGVGDYRLDDITALADPCPLPSAAKKKGLRDKEKLFYAPMSGLGDLLYDKDAVYITIKDDFVQYSKDGVDGSGTQRGLYFVFICTFSRLLILQNLDSCDFKRNKLHKFFYVWFTACYILSVRNWHGHLCSLSLPFIVLFHEVSEKEGVLVHALIIYTYVKQGFEYYKFALRMKPCQLKVHMLN